MKRFLTNRRGQQVAVEIDTVEGQRGLAFVMHGLGGFKEQPQVVAAAEAFREAGITTVRFDTTNTLGESDGKYEDATVTNYYEDLCDAIAWSSAQPWYQEPFFLWGHSIGGMSVTLYAEHNPSKVKGLVPASPLVSGKLNLETYDQGELARWKEEGFSVSMSRSKPGVEKRLKWSHMEDRLRYDLLPLASKLSMPVLIMVGDRDTGTPIAHQQLLYDALPGEKELFVIKGAAHTYRKEEHLLAVREKLIEWLGKRFPPRPVYC